MNLFSNFSFRYVEEKDKKNKEEERIYKKWASLGIGCLLQDDIDKLGLYIEFEKGYKYSLDETIVSVSSKEYETILFPLIYRTYTNLKKPIDIIALTHLYNSIHTTNFNDLNQITGLDVECEIVRLVADEYIRLNQDI